MLEYIKKILAANPNLKKLAGVFLVLVGLTALVTPFTPGSWLIFVGLEFLGIRFLVWDKLKARFWKK
ncbi:MAG: PGPGW domain-containing protein [bacterium]|nr:PGPGW domain-containing protein [bacterium]